MTDVFDAIIGGTPTNPDELKAMAASLRKRDMLGQLGQLSGDKVLSPVGAQASKAATAEAGQLGLDRWRKSQLDSQEKLRLATLGQSQNYRNDKIARDDAYRLTKQLDSTGLSKTLPAFMQLRSKIKGYTDAGEDIPGAAGIYGAPGVGGMVADAAGFMSDQFGEGEIGEVQSLLAGVINPILASRSGAAVTTHEEKRLLKELVGGKVTEQGLIRGLSIIERVMQSELNNAFGGISSEGQGLYNQQGGTITRDMLTMPQAQQPVGAVEGEPFPGFSLLSPEEQAKFQ